MSKEWSNWFLLSEDNLEKLGNIPGIYRIKLVYKNNGKDKPIPRFLKEDKQGIIYIGETKKGLKSRLESFKKAYLDDKYHPHSGGNLLHFIIKKLSLILRINMNYIFLIFLLIKILKAHNWRRI